jgi:charged multivesicular body protein 6
MVEKLVVEGLKKGSAALKEIQAEMSMDSVERLLEETREAAAYQHEISAMLSSRLDESEQYSVEEEYEQIIREIEKQQPTRFVRDEPLLKTTPQPCIEEKEAVALNE